MHGSCNQKIKATDDWKLVKLWKLLNVDTIQLEQTIT